MARLPTLSVLLSMKAIFDAIEQNPYPEKAAEQLSQGRTGADPTRPAFTLQSLETGAMAGQPSLRADYRVLTSILFCCCIASGVFGQRDGQHAILEICFDLVPIHACRQ